ncbi:hypothetical protein WA1_32695 [Scytonema hofmannii PCC 7110]|uniref:DUF4347 domain-containing protein n=1 Tax=Scytonema hofmannii PCC 7110 TaxID=128403 RepID=A0A139X468_9CYAN|nr:DUF4347 domain-containing protein [Scytonema hofmannii]KYC39478.1 hypothetical protein WA1_32695 [Scytonema hofmannii PCC 7110]
MNITDPLPHNTDNLQPLLSQTSAFAEPHSIHDLSRHSKHLVFIDSKVEQIDTLIAGIKSAEFEVTVLDGDRVGIFQISDVLKQHSNVSSVHIFSHGKVNHVELGNTSLNHDTLINYQDELKSWSQFLSEDADLLLYGCNVGQGDAELAFLQQM